MMTGSTLFGFLTIIKGAFEKIGAIDQKPAALKKALINENVNSTVMSAYRELAVKELKEYPDMMTDCIPIIVFQGFLVIFIWVLIISEVT